MKTSVFSASEDAANASGGAAQDTIAAAHSAGQPQLIIDARVAPTQAHLTLLWGLQQRAYQVEASLLGVAEFPPLRETLDELKGANEEFWLGWEQGSLVGALSIQRGAVEHLICRLVTEPAAFRRGIARRLLENLLDAEPDAKFLVRTASANIPALNLYRSAGFRMVAERKTPEGITVLELRRPGRKD